MHASSQVVASKAKVPAAAYQLGYATSRYQMHLKVPCGAVTISCRSVYEAIKTPKHPENCAHRVARVAKLIYTEQ